MKKLIVFVSALFLSSYVHAQSASSQSGLAKATSAASIGLNVWMGKIMMEECPAVAMNCAVAAMSFAQVPVQVQTLISSGDAESGISANPGGLPDFSDNPTGYDDSAGGPSPEQINQFAQEAEEGLKKLKENGYNVNRKTGAVTGPNGKTASGADFRSGEALADTGLIPEGDIQGYNDVLKEMKKKKDKIIVKSLGGAKGGYSAKNKRKSASINFDNYPYGGGIDKSKIRAAKTSGLTKDFGGTPIGVASDDLFNMVSERYSQIADKEQFIDNAAGTYSNQR